jgi:tRNA A-37 threonylcarbamoyl transferase component Bud32
VRWSFGSPELRERVERWAGAEPGAATAPHASVVAESHGRRLIRLDDGSAAPLLLKVHRHATGRHALRDRIKRSFGRVAAEREWRALRRAYEMGVAVPEPLGRARLADGDELVVERFVAGPLLANALASRDGGIAETLLALGTAIHALHAGGLAHGDLHAGNLILSEAGPVLLDWQSARRCRGPGDRAATHDLALLDASLGRLGVSSWDRHRLCCAALGFSEADTSESRAAVEAIAQTGVAARERHAHNLTRRSLRPGDSGVPWCTPLGQGLRRPDVDAATLEKALEADLAALARSPGRATDDGARVLKADGRTSVSRVSADGREWVVKAVRRDGPGRLLEDRLKRGPAQRAWRAAAGLRSRDIPCAEPVAFLAGPAIALHRREIWVMEPLGEWTASDPAIADALGPDALADALVELAIALHRAGIWHADLKGGNVRLGPHAGGWQAAPLDLEDVYFPRRLSDARRLANLAQLNASLPESLLSAEQRERAFARYAAALPFAGGNARARRRIIAQSLDRQHAWRGADCAAPAQSPSG